MKKITISVRDHGPGIAVAIDAGGEDFTRSELLACVYAIVDNVAPANTACCVACRLVNKVFADIRLTCAMHQAAVKSMDGARRH